MVLAQPIPWGDIYSALYTWAYGVTGITTVWADQDEPRPSYPYILLDVIAMPREGGVDEVRRTVDLTRARDIKLTPLAEDSTLYTVAINSTAFVYGSDSDATVAEITAGLKALIDAGSEPVSTTDNGTDLDIISDFQEVNPTIRQLMNVVVTDDFDDDQLSWVNNDIGNEVAFTATGRREFTLNIQAFDRNTRTDNRGSDPDRNAFNQLSILQASLGLPSVQATLRAVDVAIIEELAIQDISSPVEDAMENRASMDVRMRTISQLTEYLGYVDTVTGTGTFDAGDETITETYEAEA